MCGDCGAKYSYLMHLEQFGDKENAKKERGDITREICSFNMYIRQERSCLSLYRVCIPLYCKALRTGNDNTMGKDILGQSHKQSRISKEQRY